jgi:hypothetical protein
MEPASKASAVGHFVRTISDALLWLLVATAAFPTAVIAIPTLSAPLAPQILNWFELAAMAAWILVVARAIFLAPHAIIALRADRHAKRRFVCTPEASQSSWHIATQNDGSEITQLQVRFTVKNRTGEPLYLRNARLIKPRIRGEVLSVVLTVEMEDGRTHATTFVSGNNVPARGTAPFSLSLKIRGTPRQPTGKMSAVLEITEAEQSKADFTIDLPYA